MDRNLLRVLAAVMMFAVTPAFADKATQMWRCEVDDDATEEQVMEGARKWLAAAKKVKGGANLQAYVFHPVAVNSTGEIDLIFMVLAPNFKEWGEFWDAYPDSPAADVEQKIIACPDSVLWEAHRVEPKKEMRGAAPSSRGKATQMWRCEIDDDATEEQVMEGAQKWLAAAKKVKGGENLEAYVFQPVAVNATAEIDMIFMLTAPTFKQWGEFWDGYPDSPAADIEKETEEIIVCPDSVLWEATKVE